MTEAAGRYCLPVQRIGDRFTPDLSLSEGVGDLPTYASLRSYFHRGYTSIQAPVEIEGVIFEAEVFEAESVFDSSYALVDASGVPSAASSVFERLWASVAGYLDRLRSMFSFSEPFPPTHRSYLLTEFIEPNFRRSQALLPYLQRRVSWRELCGYSRVVILGPPGSGKTSCLRKLTLEEARRDRSDRARRIPVYLQLREYSGRLDIMRTAMHSLGEQHNREDWKALLGSGRFLMMLDGVDELSPDDRDTLHEQVARVAREFPSVGIFLTARDAGFDWDLPGFAYLELEPFDFGQQHEWIARRVGRTSDRLARRLTWLISSDEAMSRLAGNPLLLAVAAGYVERVENIPAKPSTLMLRYIEGLVEDWDLSRGVRRWSPITFPKEAKLDFLCRTAFEAFVEKKSVFNKDEVVTWESRWSSRDWAERALETLWSHSGLLMPTLSEDDLWQFSHDSIEEIMVAKYLVERPDDLFPRVISGVPDEKAKSVWLHSCALTMDASPLLEFMMHKFEVSDSERAELVAKAILGGASIPEDVFEKSSGFVAEVFRGVCEHLRVTRSSGSAQQWEVVLEPRDFDEESDSLLRSCGRLVRAIASGMSEDRRRSLARLIHDIPDAVCRTLGARVETGGSIQESLGSDSESLVLIRTPLSTGERCGRLPKALPS